MKPLINEAIDNYPHRHTMEHRPSWANIAVNGKYHGPQFKTDEEWYENTEFDEETKYATSINHSYPLGKMLDKPYTPSASLNNGKMFDEEEIIDEEAVKKQRQKSSVALAGQALRKELKEKFPKLKFSIKTKNYAGGDSLNLDIYDQPPAIFRAVENIANKYQYGSFDGMTDMYNYDNKVEGLPQAKYVFVNNNKSSEMQDFIEDFIINTFSQETINHNRSLIWQLFSGASNVDDASTDMWTKWFAKHNLHESDLYFVQPNGKWKKNGDGRSKGLKKDELPKNAKIMEATTIKASEVKIGDTIISGKRKEVVSEIIKNGKMLEIKVNDTHSLLFGPNEPVNIQ